MHDLLLPPLPAELESLRARHQRYGEKAAGAYAANTLKAWAADAKLFWDWCQAQDRTPLPALPETGAAFIQSTGATRKVASVRRYLASLGALHRAAQLADPTKPQDEPLALRTLPRAKAIP